MSRSRSIDRRMSVDQKGIKMGEQPPQDVLHHDVCDAYECFMVSLAAVAVLMGALFSSIGQTV